MLKRFRCDCGYASMVQREKFYHRRLTCPNCRTINVHLFPSNKVMEVFENAILQLAQHNDEDAVLGFGRGYELYLKHVLFERRYHVPPPNLSTMKPNPNVPRLARLVGKRFKVNGLTPIQRQYRNEIEHDPERLATHAEALAYAEHVVRTMELNLRELLGDALIRGESGHLNNLLWNDPEEKASAWMVYGYHRMNGNIGYVKTTRAWLDAYKQGREDWDAASWASPSV
jgi:hypothetical protein